MARGRGNKLGGKQETARNRRSARRAQKRHLEERMAAMQGRELVAWVPPWVEELRRQKSA